MHQRVIAMDRVVVDGMLRVDMLRALGAKPKPFEPGERLFWDDPHISGEMLKAHLDPTTDAASRRPETIDRIVDWIVDHLGLMPGDSILDLGCGPGLYCQRFHDHGLRVTGIDYSHRSLDYARRSAAESGRNITYTYQDYLTLDLKAQFDAVVLIYGDFAVFSPDKRAELLRRVRGALKPGGRFVFDVFTPSFRPGEERSAWTAKPYGFWRPEPYLCLQNWFYYAEEELHCDQYIVIDEDFTVRVFRNWDQRYTPETMAPVLREQGFARVEFWDCLAGDPYREGVPCLGVVCS